MFTNEQNLCYLFPCPNKTTRHPERALDPLPSTQANESLESWLEESPRPRGPKGALRAFQVPGVYLRVEGSSWRVLSECLEALGIPWTGCCRILSEDTPSGFVKIRVSHPGILEFRILSFRVCIRGSSLSSLPEASRREAFDFHFRKAHVHTGLHEEPHKCCCPLTAAASPARRTIDASMALALQRLRGWVWKGWSGAMYVARVSWVQGRRLSRFISGLEDG